MAYRFTPLKDFESEETKSHYCKGLGYTVRDGNEKLHALVQKWIKESKVTLGEPSVPAPVAEVSGAGNTGD